MLESHIESVVFGVLRKTPSCHFFAVAQFQPSIHGHSLANQRPHDHGKSVCGWGGGLIAEIDGTSRAGIAEHEGMLWIGCGTTEASGSFLAKMKVPLLQASDKSGKYDPFLPAMNLTSIRHGLAALLSFSAASAQPLPATIEIGSRRELFVDDHLIARMDGAALKVQQPQPQEVVFTTDAPWEGNTSAYFTLFQDGDLYRMYYRGSHEVPKSKETAPPQVTCYAESRDGITWRKPELGIHEFQGSKANNIIWTGNRAHNFTVFKDSNPTCPPEARYKAVGGSLVLHQSADGIHWAVASSKSLTKKGTFDSQNLLFYDAHRGEYRAYWRISNTPVRAIGTFTSKDLNTWEPPQFLQYPEGTPQEHLYTNAIQPYFRAPHLLVGFPSRFFPKGQRVEPIFMSSRDGLNFRRFNDAIIPETAPQDRSGNRSNYMTWGLLSLPGRPGELSCYATEGYRRPVPGRVRRFTYRIDGFASVHADADATLITKPLTFTGSKLSLNIVSKGQTHVELQNPDGKPLPGFSVADCAPITGDFTERTVTWKSGADLSKHAGHPVRLCFVMKSADLYSFQFAP